MQTESLISPLPQNQTDGINNTVQAKTFSCLPLLISLNTRNNLHSPANEKRPKNKVMMRYLLKETNESSAEIFITNRLEAMPKYPE